MVCVCVCVFVVSACVGCVCVCAPELQKALRLHRFGSWRFACSTQSRRVHTVSGSQQHTLYGLWNQESCMTGDGSFGAHWDSKGCPDISGY